MSRKAGQPNLYIYRQKIDSGAAPHVSKQGILSLTICKPDIRRVAKTGDYVMALVSKTGNPKIVGKGEDKHYKMSYLFKVNEKIHMREYLAWCTEHAKNKIPSEETEFMGDCQYDANLTHMPGPHGPNQRNRNLRGCFSIISHEFGAFTFQHPHTLTLEEVTAIGLDPHMIETMAQGHRVATLTDEQQHVLDQLMLEAPVNHTTFLSVTEAAPTTAASACGSKKSCGTKKRRGGGKKKARHTRKH